MAPATVNNHLAHLSALFSWISVHAPPGLLRYGDPAKKVEGLRLPAPQVRALVHLILGTGLRRAGVVALADYLENERPGGAEDRSEALFLAAASIGTHRPGGRLSPRSINTVVAEIGLIHDLETPDPDRRLDSLRPRAFQSAPRLR
ncbi:hypothetical protein SMC26_16100 [Actinomadura fulvescens]|uniref:Integrase n=1 Tax=Actinomadura fulvescens TaxID=46160 RepID=A0ABN3QVU9_9ACTN